MKNIDEVPVKSAVKESPLSPKQQRRVKALKEAREVLAHGGTFSCGTAGAEEVLKVARYILTGEE